jgi:hypothetical protein
VGTFHSGKGDLHGITVVVDTQGSRVYVGRCDEVRPEGVVLLDADEHDESAPGPGGRRRSKAEYLRDAARFGVWKKHERLLVPSAEVRSIQRLGEMAQ